MLDQLANLTSYPGVKSRLDAGEMTLHGWVYDLRGELFVYNDETAKFSLA